MQLNLLSTHILGSSLSVGVLLEILDDGCYDMLLDIFNKSLNKRSANISYAALEPYIIVQKIAFTS